MTRTASAPSAKAKALLVLGLAVTIGPGLTALIALIGLGKLQPDIDPAAVPAWLWRFRGDPLVRHWLGLGAVASLAATSGLVLALLAPRPPPLHGAARWAGAREIDGANLRAADGVILGRQGGRLLSFGGEEHVMLYAPTRTGKGVGLVIPNLLAWPGSVVVLDIKRENWAATAGWRAEHGHAVHLFDPLDPAGRTARFNPLGHIERTDPLQVIDELQKIAAMLFPTPINADPFWAEAARIGLVGVGAYLAETPERPFTLGAVYAELTQGDARTRLTAIVKTRTASGRPLSAGCASALNDFCSASENTFASIKQTITARMNLWLSPRVCAATESSDFDLRQIRSRRMAIYLAVSPDNLERAAPLYNLLFQQLIDLNTRQAPGPGERQVPVLVLLDEFARLGQAMTLAHGFSYVAGYGLRLMAVLQSPAQLRAQYGADLAEEIMANCGVEVAFAPKELKVARDLSDRLGSWTYRARSRSRPAGFSSGRRSLSESDQRRPLMLPQELIQMPPGEMIVLRAGLPPIKARKIVYWRERVFRRRLRPPPTLVQRPLPPPEAPLSSPDDLSLRMALPMIAAIGGDAPPPPCAGEDQVEAWVQRFVDQAIAHEAQGGPHAR